MTRNIQFFGNISRLSPERADELSGNFGPAHFALLKLELCSRNNLWIIQAISL
jgi:hypothetical protein